MGPKWLFFASKLSRHVVKLRNVEWCYQWPQLSDGSSTPTLTSSKPSASTAEEVKITCSFDNPTSLAASPSVKWYLNGTEFTSNIDDTSVTSNPSGSSVYTISSASKSDSGYYKCKVSYNVGSLEGTSANLTQYVETIYDTSQSYNFESQTATLTCSVGGGTGSIKWTYKNTSDVDFSSPTQYSEKLMSHSGFYMQSVIQVARLAVSTIELKCTVTFDSGNTLDKDFTIKTAGKRHDYLLWPWL